MKRQSNPPLGLDKFIARTNPRLHTDSEDARWAELLDRILDKGIALEPSLRVVLGTTDFHTMDNRIVIVPQQGRQPFIVPARKQRH